MTAKAAVSHIVKESAKCIGMRNWRRTICGTCARLCQASGGELEQIHFFWARFGANDRTLSRLLSSGFGQPPMIALA
jgi:hypothetical protein